MHDEEGTVTVEDEEKEVVVDAVLELVNGQIRIGPRIRLWFA